MSVSEEPENLDLFAPPPGRDPEPESGAAPLEGPPPLWAEVEPRPASPSRPPAPSRPRIDPAPTRVTGDVTGDQASTPVAGTHEPSAPTASTRPEGKGPRVWSVSQVNRGVRTLLESNFSQVWVGGEVGRWTRHNSGHCYFTLKDDRAQLRCVMFQSDASKLPTDPDEGMTVRVFGNVTLYEGRGEFQLVVRRLETDTGEGLWRLAFQRLQARLDAEGLLDPARKRALPRYPTAVGVVTSPTGAALRDILTVVERRAPWTRVVVAGARVQGEGAGAEVAAAIDALGRSGLVDVIIAGRGGGSIEDLWAFNEEVVARAVVSSPVPVISAVGHEVDVTISDLVADHRAPTPSAAAEAAVPDGVALEASLEGARQRLVRGLRSSVAARTRRVRDGVAHLGRAARRLLEPRRQMVHASQVRMQRAVQRMFGPRRGAAVEGRARLARAMSAGIETRRQGLAAIAGRMQALSPLATLTRGYAVPLDSDGRVLRSVDSFEPDAPFVLRVVDGRVQCQALDAERIEEGLGEEEHRN